MPDRLPLDPTDPDDLALLIEYAYLGAGVRSGVPVDRERWRKHDDTDEVHCQRCSATETFDRIQLLMKAREAQESTPADLVGQPRGDVADNGLPPLYAAPLDALRRGAIRPGAPGRSTTLRDPEHPDVDTA
jgi:hypothetical protein